MRKNMKAILKAAESNGCTVVATRNGHYKIMVKGGGIVHTSGTPSDHRALRNTIAQIRRAGGPDLRQYV